VFYDGPQVRERGLASVAVWETPGARSRGNVELNHNPHLAGGREGGTMDTSPKLNIGANVQVRGEITWRLGGGGGGGRKMSNPIIMKQKWSGGGEQERRPEWT